MEIVSPGSAAMDDVIKRREFAAAGVPRYWVVERDTALTVTPYASDSGYQVAAKMPLGWLLQTSPADQHLQA